MLNGRGIPNLVYKYLVPNRGILHCLKLPKQKFVGVTSRQVFGLNKIRKT